MDLHNEQPPSAAAAVDRDPAPLGPHAVDSRETHDVCIYYGGRRYQTSTKHAGIFLRHALAVAARHETELVVLVHRDGADLLLITAAMPLSVGGVEGRLLDREIARHTT